MAPVKFDDIPKEATSILNDDYQTSGYQLKTKQKTNWQGAVFSTQVDIFADDKCSTPAKLTWKLPQPFGCPYFCVDKLEMDKGGKFKLEASKDGLAKGLKVEVKSDLADLNKVVLAKTYTGIDNTSVKFECKATNPKDFTAEVTYAQKQVTGGLKVGSAVLKGGLPDVGVRFTQGPFFAALMASKDLSTFAASASYKATPEVKVAATASATKKDGFSAATVGVLCKGLYRAKASTDGSVCMSAKYLVAPGVSALGGVKYGSKDGALSYGVQLSLE